MAVIAGAARAAFRAALPTFIKRGLGATASYRAFKIISPLRMSKQRFLDVFRQVSGIEKMQNVIRFVRKDRMPGKNIMATTERAMPRNYLFKVRLDVYDDAGNLLRTSHTSIMGDENMTPRAAQDAALENMLMGQYVEKNVNYRNPVLVGAFKSPGV